MLGQAVCINFIFLALVIVVVAILFPTEYKQWRTEHMGNMITFMEP